MHGRPHLARRALVDPDHADCPCDIDRDAAHQQHPDAADQGIGSCSDHEQAKHPDEAGEGIHTPGNTHAVDARLDETQREEASRQRTDPDSRVPQDGVGREPQVDELPGKEPCDHRRSVEEHRGNTDQQDLVVAAQEAGEEPDDGERDMPSRLSPGHEGAFGELRRDEESEQCHADA